MWQWSVLFRTQYINNFPSSNIILEDCRQCLLGTIQESIFIFLYIEHEWYFKYNKHNENRQKTDFYTFQWN